MLRYFFANNRVSDALAHSVLNAKALWGVGGYGSGVRELIQVGLYRGPSESSSFRDLRGRGRAMFGQEPKDGNLGMVAAKRVNGRLQRGGHGGSDVSGHGFYHAATY